MLRALGQIPAIAAPSPLTDPTAALAASLHDRYTLERPLGQGGMATVYLAQDLKHDRPVALKVRLHELDSCRSPPDFRGCQRPIRRARGLLERAGHDVAVDVQHIEAELWPSNSCATFTGRPIAKRIVAAVCRRS